MWHCRMNQILVKQWKSLVLLLNGRQVKTQRESRSRRHRRTKKLERRESFSSMSLVTPSLMSLNRRRSLMSLRIKMTMMILTLKMPKSWNSYKQPTISQMTCMIYTLWKVSSSILALALKLKMMKARVMVMTTMIVMMISRSLVRSEANLMHSSTSDEAVLR